MNNFRLLKADEIEVRFGRLLNDDKGKAIGYTLLLYKDARVDQNLLDETVGQMNWKKSYSRDNANCTVSIWDDEKKQWIDKEDTGTESNTEAAKGLASDSFKRACFCWGIGRELYTAPKIAIWEEPKRNKTFEVAEIGYDEKSNINRLVIVDSKGNEVYSMGKKAVTSKPQEKIKAEEPKTEPVVDDRIAEASAKARVIAYVNNNKLSSEDISKLCKAYKVASVQELTLQHCNHYINFILKQGGQI